MRSQSNVLAFKCAIFMGLTEIDYLPGVMHSAK